jgi:hypothetical protein
MWDPLEISHPRPKADSLAQVTCRSSGRRRVLQPRLTALFKGLDGASVNWCLSHIPSVPATPQGDVDLLIDPSHVSAMCHVLLSQGFITVPGWTELPDMLWVDLDELSGCFLVLDITDEIVFGPGRRLRINERAGCLARRRHDGAHWRLDDDDGYWVALPTQRKDERTQAQNEAERLEYLALATEIPRIRVLDAGVEPAAICASALSFVWDCYRRRWLPRNPGATKLQQAHGAPW